MREHPYPSLRPKKLPGSLYDNNGCWYWRVTLPGSTRRRAFPLKRPDGKSLPATMPHQVAEKSAWRMYDAARQGHAPTSSGRRQSLQRLSEDYQDHANIWYRSKITGKPSAQAVVVRVALNELLAFRSDQPPSVVTAEVLRSLVDAWITRGLTRNTINHYLGCIRRFYAWLLEHGQVDAYSEAAINRFPNLARDRSRAKETEPVKPVRIEAVQALLPRLTPTLRDMVLVQYICSMRPGEVCRMTPAEIDRSDDALWMYEPTHHKTKHRGKLRLVTILPEARKLLEPRMAQRGDQEPIFSAADSYMEHLDAKHDARKTPANEGTRRKANPMIRAGNIYEPSSYGHAIRKASHRLAVDLWRKERGHNPPTKPKAGEKDTTKLEVWKAWQAHLKAWCFTPYQLRHAGATQSRTLAGKAVAAILLGHAQGSAITDVYTHTVLRDEAREQAKAELRDAVKALEQAKGSGNP